MGLLGAQLPDFLRSLLVPAHGCVVAHPDGVVDLMTDMPVDLIPSGAQVASDAVFDARGYPLTVGTIELRTTVHGWLERHRDVRAETDVLPTIGSKETVALLPSLLGLGAADAVGFPRASCPTCDVGARLAGAKPVSVSTDVDPSTWPTMSTLWLNSPGSLDEHVFGVECLRTILAWMRERGVMIVSDRCYVELVWDVPKAPSILDERACDGDVAGLLCLYSLSRQSNMAGYWAAFFAGDPAMIGLVAEICKYAGFLMPGPVQAAMTWALGDSAHVVGQRAAYARRREELLAVLDAAGLVSDPLSAVGLYIWATAKWPVDGVTGSNHDGDSMVEASTGWDVVRACAELGTIIAPNDLYGEAECNRMRIFFTAIDSATDEAVHRLPRLPEALRRGQLWRASGRLATAKGLLRYLLSLCRISDEELGLSR